eukprot:g4082.t1
MQKSEVNTKLASGFLFEGILRVNKKRRSEAYVSVRGILIDICISGDLNRNRAFDGDRVAVELVGEDEWQERGDTKEEKDSSSTPTVAATHVRSNQPQIEADLSQIDAKDNDALWPMQYDPMPATEVTTTEAQPNASSFSDSNSSLNAKVSAAMGKVNDTIATKNIQPAARVVYILERDHRTDLIGNIRISVKQVGPLRPHISFLLFSPRDP